MGDLVPLGDDARRIRRAVSGLPLAVHLRWVGESVNRMARQIGEAFMPGLRLALEAFSRLAADFTRLGLLPPDPKLLRHGTVWTSPLDGTRYRVRGRRGRPRTFHWGRP